MTEFRKLHEFIPPQSTGTTAQTVLAAQALFAAVVNRVLELGRVRSDSFADRCRAELHKGVNAINAAQAAYEAAQSTFPALKAPAANAPKPDQDAYKTAQAVYDGSALMAIATDEAARVNAVCDEGSR